MPALSVSAGDRISDAVLATGAILLVFVAGRALQGRPFFRARQMPIGRTDGVRLLALGFLAVLVEGAVLTYIQKGPASLALALTLASPAAAYLAWRIGPREALHPAPGLARAIGRGPVFAWMAYPVVIGAGMLVAFALVKFHLMKHAETQEAVNQIQQHKGHWRILALFTVLGAPALEETALRGMLYTALRQRLKPILSAVISALAFAFMHYAGGWKSVPLVAAMFVFALFLAHLLERTGSLLSCIATHATFNGFNVAMLLWFGAS